MISATLFKTLENFLRDIFRCFLDMNADAYYHDFQMAFKQCSLYLDPIF